MLTKKCTEILGIDKALSKQTGPKTTSPARVALDFGLAAVGGVAGYFLFKKKHPVLGVLGGMTIGSNVVPLAVGPRADALVHLGVETAAIGAALVWKKHPALGYIGGALVGMIGVAGYTMATKK